MRWPVALWMVALTFPGAGEAGAQTLLGRVLEEGSERPVSTALVRMVERDGELRATTLSDTLGNFTLVPPEAGEYYLEIRRIGYEEARSPLLALGEEGEHEIDLLVQPLPVGLEGFEVTVAPGSASEQVERDLRHYGLDPDALGNRFITREDLAEMPFLRSVSAIFDWHPVPGLRRSGACFRFRRGTSFTNTPCAIVVLNGVEMSNEFVDMLAPEWIERVVVLTPSEAIMLYGFRGELGAVMIWTGPEGR